MSTGTYFVVNKQSNLPYQFDSTTTIQNKNGQEIIQTITGTGVATLTGVNISNITTTSGVSNIFTGTLLASFGGNMSVIEKAVLGNSSIASIPETPSVNIPSAPAVSAASSITQTSITWNWQSSVNATSYQFSADNSTWTDKGNIISFNETGLTCATSYTRYIKACNTGRCSNATTLNSTNTSGCPFLATGGMITYTDSDGLNPRSSPAYPGGYTVHTFTEDGTFTPNSAGIVEYLIVGGGGGSSCGGGGGGGYLEGTGFPVEMSSYSITIGSGGAAAGNATTASTNGGASSVFSTIVAAGGGAGGNGINKDGSAGGSGGGECWGQGSSGIGNIPNTTPAQGNNGGMGGGAGADSFASAGGGGAGSAGATVSGSIGGAGGIGRASSISGISTYYAGGGGGNGAGSVGIGGLGGGGNGGLARTTSGSAGAPNTGGGGGGDNYNNIISGASGGSGIVIIRYLTN